jgi:hypothetical protein
VTPPGGEPAARIQTARSVSVLLAAVLADDDAQVAVIAAGLPDPALVAAQLAYLAASLMGAITEPGSARVAQADLVAALEASEPGRRWPSGLRERFRTAAAFVPPSPADVLARTLQQAQDQALDSLLSTKAGA